MLLVSLDDFIDRTTDRKIDLKAQHQRQAYREHKCQHRNQYSVQSVGLDSIAAKSAGAVSQVDEGAPERGEAEHANPEDQSHERERRKNYSYRQTKQSAHQQHAAQRLVPQLRSRPTDKPQAKQHDLESAEQVSKCLVLREKRRGEPAAKHQGIKHETKNWRDDTKQNIENDLTPSNHRSKLSPPETSFFPGRFRFIACFEYARNFHG